MFTGIVEAIGEVAEVRSIPAGLRLRVATGLASGLAVGDSVAVNGVCLTVVLCDAGEFHAEVSPETARVTALGATSPGSKVNLERPLRPDGRLGGTSSSVMSTVWVTSTRSDRMASSGG